MGDIIVIAVLAGIVALVVRSMWKDHKSGKHCLDGLFFLAGRG